MYFIVELIALYFPFYRKVPQLSPTDKPPPPADKPLTINSHRRQHISLHPADKPLHTRLKHNTTHTHPHTLHHHHYHTPSHTTHTAVLFHGKRNISLLTNHLCFNAEHFRTVQKCSKNSDQCLYFCFISFRRSLFIMFVSLVWCLHCDCAPIVCFHVPDNIVIHIIK